MTALTFEAARRCVLDTIRSACAMPALESVALEAAAGRVLAAPIAADRDYPALARSVRDGYAVRAIDLPGELEVIGEVRAGESFSGEVGARQAVEIMTGAPVPRGADAVIMLEHVLREGARVIAGQGAAPGQFINPRASEARADDILLDPGKRLDYTDIAMLAAAGTQTVPVFAAPRVAIIATGDEIVPVSETPRDFQIRNSNVYSLAAQVARAGGVPEILPVARDEMGPTQELIERGLSADLLLLSGGVSAGKYDIVEGVLEGLGAEFFFDRVLIQPGQPLVFGRARGKFFFGLPGNPSSTMVTFEIFARAALEVLGGQREIALHMPFARLTEAFHHRVGLTRFLPARLSSDGAEVTPIAWRGSSDVPALTRASVFMVVEAERPVWQAGDWIRVLMK
ncbi:MAG TPA: gephyrin-like molybdotransferase Glp [Bryobacteraceae bacterium]|nr:gephyrin-like molybdotransferase Glp [Bryobacteraceae bacterium]